MNIENCRSFAEVLLLKIIFPDFSISEPINLETTFAFTFSQWGERLNWFWFIFIYRMFEK